MALFDANECKYLGEAEMIKMKPQLASAGH